MDDPESFGSWLRARRHVRDLSRADLARRVSCAIITIKKIETGERRPSRQIAELILDVLAVPADERTALVRLARTTPTPAGSPPKAPALTPADLALDDLSGRVIRNYTLHERLGAGGFGVVYRAEQPGIGRAVAIKIILPQYANLPEFIRRFEAEAQIIARLEHPHIIPLYDYWREPGGTYLVMRYVTGGTLHAALQRGPLPLDTVARVLEQVGAALAVAHRAGVVHRDLKPSNILMDSDGNAYLADFGIAKDVRNADANDQTQAGRILGSPAYLSPEQIRDEPVTPLSDIYSLGIMLYELLTSAKPFQARTPAELLQKHINEVLPPLRARRADLPEALEALIQRATAKNPADRYPDVLALMADFRRTIVPRGAAVPEGAVVGRAASEYATAVVELSDLINPYKGLRSFTEADAAHFFGRAALVAHLLERLAEESVSQKAPGRVPSFAEDDRRKTADNQQPTTPRFLAVVGPSGSGKSSVVRAGLIPALRRGGVPGSEHWFVAELLPGTHPLEELELALLRLAADSTPNLAEQLGRDERGLLRAARLVLPPDDESELLIVIDQFEELFTLVEDEAVRLHVLNNLVAAVCDERSRVRVVITLRADFMDRPLQYGDFGDLLRRQAEFVLPLMPDELEHAIVGPAEHAGLTLEPGLLAAIVSDVGEQPGTLPLVQYALTELFEQREGRMLTLTAYQTSGGVTGALARRAEEIYAGLHEPQQEAARQLFLRLISLGEGTEDTRRRVRLAELATTNHRPPITDGVEAESSSVVGRQSSAIEAVTDLYGRYRLLTFDRDPITRGPTVEIAHEALIRNWERLREWLEASRDDLRMQRRLIIAASDWTNAGRDASFLATGARLAQFAALAEGGGLALNAEERAYVDASLKAREARQAEEAARQRRELDLQTRAANRLRYLVGALTIFLLIAAGLSAFAFNQSASAQRNAAESRNLALISGSQAALANDNTDQAIALALQAVTLDPALLKAQVALGEAAYAPGTIRRFVGHNAAILEVALSPDGSTALSASEDKTLILWDIQTGQIIRRFEGHTGRVTSVAFSPDGRTALSCSEDATLILWDIATGSLIRRFVGHAATVWDVAVSSDGRSALSGADDTMMILWDIETGAIVRRFEGHSATVESVAFGPEGHILSGSDDRTMILWDMETGRVIQRFEVPDGPVYSVAFSPDGQTALSGGGGVEGTVILWDTRIGQMIRRFYGQAADVLAIAFSPDGRRALTGNNDATLVVWDIATGQLMSRLQGHQKHVRSVAFSPDGRLALSGSDDSTMRLWDLESGQVIRRYSGLGQRGIGIAVNPADGGGSALIGLEQGALVLDLQTGQITRRLPESTGAYWIIGVDYSPDGRTALLALESGGDAPADVILWDVETGQEIRRFAGHQSGVAAVDFSSDGRTAVSSGGKGSIILWDVASGKEIRRFQGYERDDFGANVFSAFFSPDGRTILTGFADGKLILWDVATGKEIRKFEGHTGIISRAIFTPDGQHIFSGAWDNTAIYWDVSTGAIVHRFTDHSASVYGVQITPDGRFGMAGSADNTTILWDLETGQVIRRYTDANIFNAAFKPDGRSAVVAFSDGSVALWRIDTSLEELVAWTRANRYVPELTCEQRALYRLEPLCAENPATPTGVGTPRST